MEVLAATALFAVLGLMLFQLVQGALEIQGRGERLAEMEERADAVLDLMATDLAHVWSGRRDSAEQDARFLCGVRSASRGLPGADGGKAGSAARPEGAVQATVLRFSRLLHEARSLEWLRQAGDRPAAEGVATLLTQQDPMTLAPTGGLAESLYTTTQLQGDVLPSLVRRVRSPLGGEQSLLRPALPEQEDRLLKDHLPLTSGVLYFGVHCWAPDTQAWDAGEQGAAGPTIALTHWDSTRALIPAGHPSFPYGVGPQSLWDARDDVFPRQVRLSLVLEPFVAGVDEGAGRLAEPLTEEATRIVLRSPVLSGDDRTPDAVWVDGEWMSVLAQDGRVWTVKRGLRGTLPAAHAGGAVVRVGKLFQRTLRLPVHREDFDG